MGARKGAMQGAGLGLAIVLGSLACGAQKPAVPIGQIERDAQLTATLTTPAAMRASYAASPGSSSSGSSASTGFVFVPPRESRERTVGPGFVLLNGLHLGMAVFDVEMTQHCIADHHCQEGNPLMPSSQAGQLGVNFALVGYGSFLSYELKKRGNGLWRLSPVVGIAAHTVGVASGFAHY